MSAATVGWRQRAMNGSGSSSEGAHRTPLRLQQQIAPDSSVRDRPPGPEPSLSMYSSFFGLERRPFTLLPDPDFMFWSRQHTRALSVLEFGLMSRAPITLVTGEVGTGKTTLLQTLMRRLSKDLTVGLISNAHGERGELLQWTLSAFGLPVDPSESYVQMFRRLQEFLVTEYAAGRRVALIFDEAQNLDKAGLEELRMLTNINSGTDELIQLILVGQPELRDTLLEPDMRQFAQRVSASCHLVALDSEATADLIRHRLRHAGGTGEEITSDAACAIHNATGGIPRLINQLCDFAMLYAWSAETKVVDAPIVAEVIGDGVFFGGQPNGRSQT